MQTPAAPCAKNTPAFRRLLVVLAALMVLVARLRHRSYLTAAELADPDSRFIDIDGLRVHYKIAGQGKPVLVLVHGSFLTMYSWRAVMPALAQHGTVIAFDRPAFGLTSRPLPDTVKQRNPYSPEGQADLIIALLDKLGIEQAILVGSSAGGTTCLLAALRHPQRVQALVLVDAMVYSGYAVVEFPRWLRPLLRALEGPGAFPVGSMISLLYERAVRTFWHDSSRLAPAVLERYRQTLQIKHWDRALWQLILSSHALGLDQQLERLTMPALVVSGEHDRAVPAEQSVRLAEALPHARLTVIPDCGHLPHEEQPDQFLPAVTSFLVEGGHSDPH